jgi:hypothetical protein
MRCAMGSAIAAATAIKDGAAVIVTHPPPCHPEPMACEVQSAAPVGGPAAPPAAGVIPRPGGSWADAV